MPALRQETHLSHNMVQRSTLFLPFRLSSGSLTTRLFPEPALAEKLPHTVNRVMSFLCTEHGNKRLPEPLRMEKSHKPTRPGMHFNLNCLKGTPVPGLKPPKPITLKQENWQNGFAKSSGDKRKINPTAGGDKGKGTAASFQNGWEGSSDHQPACSAQRGDKRPRRTKLR